MAGLPALTEISVECEDRDMRYMDGGNFFGPELDSEPFREPLQIDEDPAAPGSGNGGASAAAASHNRGGSKTPP